MAKTEIPAPAISRASLGLATYVHPDGPLETKLASIFAEVFSLDQVGVTDDFFDLGGDSLLAEVLSMRILEQTGLDFPISSLALEGSPRKIAALLAPTSADTGSSKGERPPIFIIHGRVGYALLSAEFVSGLADGQKIHIFEAPGIRGGPSYDSIEAIAAVFTSRLTQIHPEGPVLVAAFCVGGLVALEMAAQLSALGRPVQQLVLLDPGNPYKLNKIKRAEFAGKPPKPAKSREPWRRYIPPIKILDRWRLGTLANDIRRYRQKFAKRRKNAGDYTALSIPAQAKLFAAYEHYQPKAFSGPVTIITSMARDNLFRSASRGWLKLLPQAEIDEVFDRHGEVNTGPSAQAMQAIFDAALARDNPATKPAHSGTASRIDTNDRVGMTRASANPEAARSS